MTVRELIEILSKVPLDSMVLVHGYEGGYDNPSLDTQTIVADSNWNGSEKKSYSFGRHDKYHNGIEADDIQPVNAVIIGRGK